ncbi:MAG: hypothetical protein HQL96_10680 [Magnetococcales bacterium]|nr:hypothetical protein [Magnetococcales bacterium]
MSRRWLGGIGVGVALFVAGESEAGLFCSVDNMLGKRCQYTDLDSCRRAVGKQGGCVLNEAEIAKPFGNAPYCLVESWRTECVYNDMASCERQAATTKTVCMANPEGSMGGSPFAGQVPRAGIPAMPGMPGMPAVPGQPPMPGMPQMPSSGGVGATMPTSTGYWPGQ